MYPVSRIYNQQKLFCRQDPSVFVYFQNIVILFVLEMVLVSVCMSIIESRKRSWTDSTESLHNVGLIFIPKIVYTKSIQNVYFCDFDYFHRFKMAAVCIKTILTILKSCIFKNKCYISGKRCTLCYVRSKSWSGFSKSSCHFERHATHQFLQI